MKSVSSFELRNGLSSNSHQQPSNQNGDLEPAKESPQPLLSQQFLPQLLDTKESVKTETEANVNNNSIVVKNEDELKREEAEVDDEMKEDEDEEIEDNEENPEETKTSDNKTISKENPPSLLTEGLKQFQLNFWLKKMCEDFNKKQTSSSESGNHEVDHDEESLMSENDQDMLVNNSLNSSNNSGDERKVRVRTLISDEQLAILKSHYMKNARPKREELERISAQIGHPFKVVKVWFQNSRARDRREGKPVSIVNHGSTGLPFFNGNPAGNGLGSENPLINAATVSAASGLFPR